MDAYVAKIGGSAQITDMCENLQCRSPSRDGYFFAGPALAGTECAPNRWCDTGKCTNAQELDQLPPLLVDEDQRQGGWSSWQLDACESGCLIDSRGFQRRRRFCKSPPSVDSSKECVGSAFDVLSCEDDKVCMVSMLIL